MTASSRHRLANAQRYSPTVGLVIAAVAVAAATGAIYPLKAVAPTVALSVAYLPAVLLVSAYWGIGLGLLTSLTSAAAFNFFHIPPVGRFTIADGRNWVALAAFTSVAAVVSTMADLARSRALEAERRRREADLAAGLARELLAGTQTSEALGAAARRLAEALMIPSAAIELGVADGEQRRTAIALSDTSDQQIATLLVPRDLPTGTVGRLRSDVVPSLEALVAIALHRDAVQAEAVETEALRRSDELKTALLRTVSHDLRTPVTAIVAGGHALGGGSLTPEDREQLSAAVVEEGERLSALIEKLLDLSRLQAGRADPHRDWISIEEVLLVAQDALPGEGGEVRFSVDPNIPWIRADAAQLERAFVNVLENARRHSNYLPVSVRVRLVRSRVVIRVVDQGPGIAPAEQERIFEPFYRGAKLGARRWTGSGLGLAIARGFVEANGGSIAVESLPGQGTSFVFTFPIEHEAKVPA